MRRSRMAVAVGSLALLGLCLVAEAARAEPDTEARLKALESQVTTQQETIRQLQAALEAKGADASAVQAAIQEYLAARDLQAFAAVEGEKNPNALPLEWNKGYVAKSPSKDFSVHFGGRIYWDVSFYDADEKLEDAVGKFDDGTEFRTLRLDVSGDIYKNIFYKLQFDLAPGTVSQKDVELGIKHLPLVNHFRVGHQKEPLGLEELTSSRFVTFQERSLANALMPGRNDGFMFYDAPKQLDQRMTWAVGMFYDVNDQGKGSAGEINLTARVTGLPWYEEKGKRLVHVGLSYSHRDPHDGMLSVSSRPETHLSPKIVNSGSIPADSADLVGLELAAVYDAFSIQGECLIEWVNSDVDHYKEPTFTGWYVEASWFVTGESRNYKTSSGTFDRPTPDENLGLDDGGGFGALQLAARYSSLDLTDGDVEGGQAKDWTLGINWWLNPMTRITLNYVHSSVELPGPDGDADILQFRFQVDW